MIEVLPESQGKFLWVRARGKITSRDYEEVLIPRLESAIQEQGKVRLLCQVEEDFQGMEAGAMWDDTKFGMKHRKDFEKMALVGGTRWMDWLMKLFSPLMEGELKAFSQEQLQEAWEWVTS